MSELTNKFNSLENELSHSIQQTVNLAKSTPPKGGEEWFSFMMTMGVEPLNVTARSNALASGFQFNQGALPAEVRRVMERLKQDVADRATRFTEKHGGSAEANKILLDEFLVTLEDVVESSMGDYVLSIKPKAALAGIFANAAITTKTFEKQDAGAITKKCRCCGAARPSDTELKTCAFCGTSFFK